MHRALWTKPGRYPPSLLLRPPKCPPPPAEVPHAAPQEIPLDNVEDEWDIEVTDELDASGVRHKNAFYALLRGWLRSRDYKKCILLTKRKHDEILRFCLDIICGVDIRSLFLAGNKQAYKWTSKYNAIVVDKRGGDDNVIEIEHAVLVLRPKNSAVEAQSLEAAAANIRGEGVLGSVQDPQEQSLQGQYLCKEGKAGSRKHPP